MTAGFCAPFAAVLFVRNRGAFLFDTASGGAGVFRGGGASLMSDRSTSRERPPVGSCGLQ
jgi:hypothetical protein